MRERLRALATSPRTQVALFAAALGLALLAVMLLWRAQRQPTVVIEVQPLDDPSVVRVWVGGAVAEPGLYTLPRGSRVADALDAAGGTRPDADTASLGLAAVVEDADQITVPQRVVASSAGTAAPDASPAVSAGQGGAPGPININLASAGELEALPEIGPALAARIVEYRSQHGPFQSIDELAEISGISERMVDELRPLVTIGP